MIPDAGMAGRLLAAMYSFQGPRKVVFLVKKSLGGSVSLVRAHDHIAHFRVQFARCFFWCVVQVDLVAEVGVLGRESLVGDKSTLRADLLHRVKW